MNMKWFSRSCISLCAVLGCVAVISCSSSGGDNGNNQAPTGPTSPTAPAAPTNLQHNGYTGGLADLSFTDNSGDEDGFRVYANGGLWQTLSPNFTTFQVQPPCGSSWNVSVTAFNAAGESASSNIVSVAGYCAPPSIPAPPSDLVSPNNLDLQFKDNSNNEDGFRVYRNGALSQTLDADENNFTPVSCSGGFRVTAYNTAGESASTNTVTCHSGS